MSRRGRPTDGTRLGEIRRPYGRGLWTPLQWMGGADRRILRRVPWERVHFTTLGLLVLVPVTLGIATMTVFLSVLDPIKAPGFHSQYLLVSIVWGLLILIVDRAMIVHQPQSDATRPVRRPLLTLFMRVAFAASVAVVVTEVVIAAAFSKEALASAEQRFQADKATEIAATRARLEAEQATLSQAAEPRRNALTAQRDQLVSTQQQLFREFQASQQRCLDEIQVGSGVRAPGEGPVAEPLCREASAARA